MKRAVFSVLAALCCVPPAAVAQGVPASGELPRAVAERSVEFYNRPSTTRLGGDATIPAGTSVVGDIAVLDGVLTLGGTVQGSVLVINGDALLDETAVIEGDITVLGGSLRAEEGARITGERTEYLEPLRYARDAAYLVYAPPRMEPALMAGRAFRFGRTDFRVAAAGAYNRTEGLPVTLGPRLTLGRSNPTTLDAHAIYRTAVGFDPDDMGYLLRAEQYIGGRLAVRAGIALRSQIDPIEEWELSDRESSLATFLLHTDFRDHYERRGWSGFVRLAPPGGAHDVMLEYRDERHAPVVVRDPWTLSFTDDGWRAQPRIAEGTLRSLSAHWRLDTRNEPNAPAHGWLINGSLEQALGGSFPAVPLPLEPGMQPADVETFDDRFTSLRMDLRRYARVGPHSRLSLRLLAAGSLDGGPLPPQRQHALGGAGSLPAYPLLSFDCGARSDTVGLGQRIFHPYYGCDRSVLVQLEYHASLNLGRSLGRRFGWDIDLGDTPGWVIFFDAGRAWAESDARAGRSGGLDDFKADAGFGLRLGRIGAYWAVPLSGPVDYVNFFIRVGPRI